MMNAAARSSGTRWSAFWLNPSFENQTRSQSTYAALPNQEPYWRRVPKWANVPPRDFLSYNWQRANTVSCRVQLDKFLSATLPDTLASSANPLLKHIKTRNDFINDATQGLSAAPMSIRLTPHILSVIDWTNPLDDPIRRQFLPIKSAMVPDHPKLTLDSLHEEADSPVPGLVHRYPDKALFLATSICPVYCRFCTRSYAVGANTETISKSPQKPIRKRWEVVFQYIEQTPSLQDIVVSGGDAYYLEPEQINLIGERLLSIPHIKRFRFATKGLAVAPSRIFDPNDAWTSSFIDVCNHGRRVNKQVSLHTHFNHPNEINWVTRKAAKFLFEKGVIVRNQSVLLKGVNDNVETMRKLIRDLADMHITPYYVYQCDLVRGIEDLRTPLSTILDLEQRIRGTLAGFNTPSFVVDLPGGGGKRLASTYEIYDRQTGISTFKAPGLLGEKGEKIYEYFDPAPESG
ncbi:kama family protein [Lindgomyces ingoldianus]|uniref:Kama family protein n=1 Tax=Lindgomyces ingoldianus TaxID=673940 RepID=A0ACB6QX37_9PLEO|nr:kama family protein [Lindgomyces ingoldianus]KAF2470645.1 kama family protein [Lindgomyces ingoldianus]